MKRLGADYDNHSSLESAHCLLLALRIRSRRPYRDYPAHDMNYLSLAGVLNLIGTRGARSR